MLVSCGAVGVYKGFTDHDPQAYFTDQDGRRVNLLALQEKIDQKLTEIRYATTESRARNAVAAINIAISKTERLVGEDLQRVRAEAEVLYRDEMVGWTMSKADEQVLRGDQWKAVSYLESGKEFCRNQGKRDGLDERIAAIVSKQEDFA